MRNSRNVGRLRAKESAQVTPVSDGGDDDAQKYCSLAEMSENDSNETQ